MIWGLMGLYRWEEERAAGTFTSRPGELRPDKVQALGELQARRNEKKGDLSMGGGGESTAPPLLDSVCARSTLAEPNHITVLFSCALAARYVCPLKVHIAPDMFVQ